MPKVPKKRAEAEKKVDRALKYTLEDACTKVKETAYAKFDETVDIAVRLGVNPKHADQMVRGAVVLPHGTGQALRVLVFAKGEKAKEAEAAGADHVGEADLVNKVQEGFMDFDRVIATPDMMGLVGKLGRVLGPRGLMPNPKVGTVTFDVKTAVNEAKAGKVSFKAEALKDNASALITALVRAKPSTAKGTYLKSITLSSTMGPGVRVDVLQFTGTKEEA